MFSTLRSFDIMPKFVYFLKKKTKKEKSAFILVIVYEKHTSGRGAEGCQNKSMRAMMHASLKSLSICF